MTNTKNTPWLLMALFTVGCGGQMAPGEDSGEAGGTNSGGGTTFVAPPPLATGGATATSSWGTTTAAVGGSVVLPVPAYGGYATTTVAPPPASGYCASNTDLIYEAYHSTSGDWIGGDPASTMDNPCGIQGAIYAYSDNGLDNEAGTSDDTLQYPAIDPMEPWGRLSPCVGGRCCISGTTSRWPLSSSGGYDYMAPVWGAGIGVSLNGLGAGGSKGPYSGPARGFTVTIAGTLGGQALRIAYVQGPSDTDAPFWQVMSTGTYSVPFQGVSCPAWSSSCVPPLVNPYDLQIQIVGGDAAGPFQICIVSITPLF